MVYGLRKVGVTTLNEVKAQALVDTGTHSSTSQDLYSCLHMAVVVAKMFFDIQADRLAVQKVKKLA